MSELPQQQQEQKQEIKQFPLEWKDVFEDEKFLNHFTVDVLPDYILSQRWYGGKASTIKYIEITFKQRYEMEHEDAFGLVLEIYFKEAFTQTYFMCIIAKEIESLSEDCSEKAKIVRVKLRNKTYCILDAFHIPEFRESLFYAIREERKMQTRSGLLKFERGSFFPQDEICHKSKLMSIEQSNTSIVYNDKYMLKVYRRLFDRSNPDYEISYFLTEQTKFRNSPQFAGSVNWNQENNYTISLGLMQQLIPNQGDAWEYFLPFVKRFFNRCIERNVRLEELPEIPLFKNIPREEVPHILVELLGLDIIDRVILLAKRTAEMHVSLGSEKIDLKFTPSTYNSDYSVWLKNRLIYQFENRVNLLENTIFRLEGLTLDLANEFLNHRKLIRFHFLGFDETDLKSQRIRIHGDYHLGQVLVTEDDFYIIDFEGEPESTIRDRKVKQTPLKDVAGMLRSFHYAIYSIIFNNQEEFKLSQEQLFDLGEWLYSYLVGIFLHQYIDVVQKNNLNIGYQAEIEYLLKYSILEKAVYELGYELNARPTWTIIPLKGISQIIKTIKEHDRKIS